MLSNIFVSSENTLKGLFCYNIVATFIFLYFSYKSFKTVLIEFYLRLHRNKENPPILYSYRYSGLALVSYTLIVFGITSLHMFYTLVASYKMHEFSLCNQLLIVSESKIVSFILIAISLHIFSVVIYYVRNNEQYAKFFRNCYCILEAIVSLILCFIYITLSISLKDYDSDGDFSIYLYASFIVFILFICDGIIRRLQLSVHDLCHSVSTPNASMIKARVLEERYQNVSAVHNSFSTTLVALLYCLVLEYLQFSYFYVIMTLCFSVLFKGFTVRLSSVSLPIWIQIPKIRRL